MKTRVAILAYSLLAVGLVGLVLNEFVLHWGTAATLSFAAIEILGFVLLAVVRWRL